jgi:hypothetical protein
VNESEKTRLKAFIPLARALLTEQAINSTLHQIVLLRLGVAQEDISAIHARATAEAEQRCRSIVRELLSELFSAEELDADDWWKHLPDE